MNPTKNNILFILALLLAVWCAMAGIFWIYWFALYGAYPFGIAAFFIWKNIRKDGKKRNIIIPIILIIGLLLSFGELLWIYLKRIIEP